MLIFLSFIVLFTLCLGLDDTGYAPVKRILGKVTEWTVTEYVFILNISLKENSYFKLLCTIIELTSFLF
jgi:hypothetical protein